MAKYSQEKSSIGQINFQKRQLFREKSNKIDKIKINTRLAQYMDGNKLKSWSIYENNLGIVNFDIKFYSNNNSDNNDHTVLPTTFYSVSPKQIEDNHESIDKYTTDQMPSSTSSWRDISYGTSVNKRSVKNNNSNQEEVNHELLNEYKNDTMPSSTSNWRETSYDLNIPMPLRRPSNTSTQLQPLY